MHNHEEGSRRAMEPCEVDYFPILKQVLHEQGLMHDATETEQGEESLRYACAQVRPTFHVELAFVVAMGMNQGLSCQTLVDEFVRRRSGEPSLMEDHPVLALKVWGMPDTHRLLVFVEQIDRLLADLCGWNLLEAMQYRRLLQRGRTDLGKLRDVAEQRKPGIPADELDRIEAMLRVFINYFGAREYAFCSTMADRAERIARERHSA